MMKSSSAFTQTRITQMGASAHTCLALGRNGKVLAAFSKAIYLLTNNAELFWIVSDDSPMHRRALKISTPLSGPQAGSPFYVQDYRLTIDPGFVYEMEHASLWHTPQISWRNLVEITEIPARVQALISRLDLSQAKGFGNFIPDILRLSQNESIQPQAALTDHILVFAQPLVLDMARACMENRPTNANALIGLGSGLTPSGDDFLGGLLFCIKTLQTTYPTTNFFDHEISLEPYHTRTHLISFALLQDLANRHAIAPLHQLVNDILGGESFEIIHPSILQLTRVGHSTGWDMLAGLVTGLLTIHPSAQLNSSFQIVQSVQA
jgi:hypothetical protein